MKKLLIIIFGLFALIGVAILRLHSLNHPNLKLKDLKKKGVRNVLFIYPHPDDEAMSAGGLIIQMSEDPDFNTFVVDITKGEKGDEILKISPPELGKVREKEFYKAMFTLGADNYELWDFPDGNVPENKEKLKKKIKQYIKEKDIDLVVTYERFGIYGHQDHVTLSRVVYEISEEDRGLKVLYSTISPQIAKLMNLKQYISGLSLAEFEENELPEFKVPTYTQLLKQYNSVCCYKSQNLSHKYPLWVTILMSPYEYYTTKYKRT